MGFCDSTVGGWLCNRVDDFRSLWNWRAPAAVASCSGGNADERCDAVEGVPDPGSLAVDESDLTAEGFAVYNSQLHFILRDAADCDLQEPANLKVTLNTGYEQVPMNKNESGDYVAAVPVNYWSSVCATVEDLDRETEAEKCLYNLPTVIPNNDLCQTQPSVIPGTEIIYSTREVDAGESVSLSIPADRVVRCDGVNATEPGNDLSLFFAAINEYHPATMQTFTGQSYLSVSIDTAGLLPGYYEVGLKVVDGRTSATKIIDATSGFVVRDPSSSTDIPLVTIGNLGYAYHEGETQNNIECHSDDPDATFAWTVLRPDGLTDYFTGDLIPTYSFDEIGDYDFKCTVTAGDGITTNYEIRSTSVYPASTPIPILSIIAQNSAPVNTNVNFQVGVPETGTFRYFFNFGDSASWFESINYNKSYSQTGVYEVRLRAELISDPTVTFNLNSAHNITIY